MFRLHGCSEDDTITVVKACISSDMLRPFLLAQGRFFLFFRELTLFLFYLLNTFGWRW